MTGFVRVKKLGLRKTDRAEIAQIEYIGNDKEIQEKGLLEEHVQERGYPTYWEFHKTIAMEEVEHYGDAIRSLKEQMREATLVKNKDKLYDGYTPQDYIKRSKMSLKLLEAEKRKAELDLKILRTNKDHRFFKNCEAKYSSYKSASSLI